MRDRQGVVAYRRLGHLLTARRRLEDEDLVFFLTDVGWTPYFAAIAGLATEVGSAVSHGAVVAREHGLPAVVNLRDATRRFRTGDRVLLDGNLGVLRRLDGAD